MDHSGDENTISGMNERHSFVNDNIRNTVDRGKRLFDDNRGKGDDCMKESMIDGDFMVDLVVDEDALYDDNIAEEQLNVCSVDDDQIPIAMMDSHGNTDEQPSNPSLSNSGNQRNVTEDEFSEYTNSGNGNSLEMDSDGEQYTNSGMNDGDSVVNDNIRNPVDIGKSLFNDNSSNGDGVMKEYMIDGHFMVDLVVDEDDLFDDLIAEEQFSEYNVYDDQNRMRMMDFIGNSDEQPSNPSPNKNGNQRNLIEDEFSGKFHMSRTFFS